MKHSLLMTLILVALCACKENKSDVEPVDPYIPAPVGRQWSAATCTSNP